MSFFFGFIVKELPFIAFYYLLASTLLAIGQTGVESPVAWVGLGLACLTTVGLVVVALRGQRTGPAVDRALNVGLGVGWRTAGDAGTIARLRRRPP
jgi:hypothetical protein